MPSAHAGQAQKIYVLPHLFAFRGQKYKKSRSPKATA